MMTRMFSTREGTEKEEDSPSSIKYLFSITPEDE